MSKIIGDVNWMPVPDTPVFKRSASGVELQFKYRCTSDNLVNLPTHASALSALAALDDRLDLGGSFAWAAAYNVRLKDAIVTPSAAGPLLFDVSFNYSNDVDEPPSSEIVSDLCELDGEEVNVPLSQHPNYLVHWDHHLLIKVGSTRASPDWYLTATNVQIPDADKNTYRWLPADTTPPDGWDISVPIPDEFRGINAFMSGIAVVNRVIKSSAVNALSNDANADYTIESPPKTFGKSGQWLRGKSTITKDGRLWVLRVAYRNYKTINDKLYE